MKNNSVIILICMALFAVNVCNSKNNNGNNQTVEIMEDKTQVKEPVLGLGNPITANFSGDAWLKMLSTQPEYDCNIYNVTFAPGTRNNWHSHAVGQILLCTEGVGYYQERGKPAQRLQPGDVVNIPANTVHWHGQPFYTYRNHSEGKRKQRGMAWGSD